MKASSAMRKKESPSEDESEHQSSSPLLLSFTLSSSPSVPYLHLPGSVSPPSNPTLHQNWNMCDGPPLSSSSANTAPQIPPPPYLPLPILSPPSLLTGTSLLWMEEDLVKITVENPPLMV